MADTDFDIPVTEQELAPAPLVFQGEQLSPSPFHFRFTGEDRLQLESWNSVSGVRLAVQGRVWDPDARDQSGSGIRPFAFQHTPNSDRTLATELLTFGNGYLLNLVVFASSGAPRVGQTFVSLHVVRGASGGITRLATIIQGYVTRSQELAFPGSAVELSVGSGGVLRVVQGSTPGAGSDWLETVPVGAEWEILQIGASLQTSSAAGQRRPVLYITESGLYLQVMPAPNDIQPSVTVDTFWIGGLGTDLPTYGTIYLAPIAAGLRARAGDQIRTGTVNLQAGDTWGSPVLVVRETLEAS